MNEIYCSKITDKWTRHWLRILQKFTEIYCTLNRNLEDNEWMIYDNSMCFQSILVGTSKQDIVIITYVNQ